MNSPALLWTCICRNISTTGPKLKEVPKGKDHSSHLWLKRQFADPYVQKAKKENYRCRSAFKLLEIDSKIKFLRPGLKVLDCGAAPGSWSQVAVKLVNSHGYDSKQPKGLVLSVDKLPIYPIDGAVVLSKCDFTQPDIQDRLVTILKDDKLDVVLSDMAPNATGMREMDHDLITQLAIAVIRFAVTYSKPGADCLIKIWDGRNRPQLEESITRFYSQVKILKPPSSRSHSAELFLLGRGFKGLKSSSSQKSVPTDVPPVDPS
ncbi:rRNA methyltransferase 2, mitochondrial isoform X2 [Diaphorina citri]|uniref:rRNA methyltransferase 2, mitochondrial n=1 Tax=Diaphorina citri TaxID=121845 RepID=A0A1S4EFC6_DIACI|nr:rRNA methyltransferase 2, mitochondrial isoform X2 [Diaphorina citri]